VILVVAAHVDGAPFARATPDLRTRLLVDLNVYTQEYPNCRRIIGYTKPAPGQINGFAMYEDITIFRARHPAFDGYYIWLMPPNNGAHRNLNPYAEAPFDAGCPQYLSQQDYVNQYGSCRHSMIARQAAAIIRCRNRSKPARP
jgi:hypothetical protein